MLCAFGVARLALSVKPVGGGTSSSLSLVRDYLDALLAAGLLALFAITFVIRTYYIPSVSMMPTLQVGDVLLVDRLAYRLHPPQDGDVAVFVPPVPSHGDDFVKRVIGTPGDRISISDGTVYRNGVALREPYVNQPPAYDLSIRGYGIYVNGTPLSPALADVPPKALWQSPDRIPAGYYFMLGDNRNYSDDSHVWGFAQIGPRFSAGPLARRNQPAQFVGRAFSIVWPLPRVGVLH